MERANEARRARWVVLLAFLAVTAWLPSPSALAQANCVEFSGKIFCGTAMPKQWNLLGLCDEAASSPIRDAAWCRARGGTPGPNASCPGGAPDTEANMVQHTARFAEEMAGNTVSCSVTTDTGWGTTYFSGNCTGGGDGYKLGYLWTTSRRLFASCVGGGGQLISATKQRQFECPAGYFNGGELCSRVLDDCEGCKVGNPVLPFTGIKVETETDYRHASGLQFTRHYHSLRFSEPYTTVQENAHTENRLGVVWRSNFDKRVVPLVPADRPPKHAISLPSGSVQYFDINGTETFNYSGAAGSLAVVSGVGFFYRGPDGTEFYGPDGRLRTITRNSGMTLTLTYSDGTSGPNGGFAYDAAGNPTPNVLPPNRLIRVSDSYGNTLSFNLDSLGTIVVMTDPGGGQYRYSYDALGNLTSVTFPDARVRTYRYNEPGNMLGGASLPYALTSIVDENADLFATFKYNPNAWVASTEHAGQTQLYQLAYGTNSTAVTDPLGTVRTLGLSIAINADGLLRFSGTPQTGGAGYGTGIKQRTYDTAGNPASQTNHNDIKTCYAYLAARNLETVRVEGVPAATVCSGVLTAGASLPTGSRKITTEWHTRWRLPTRIAEPLRRTTFAYNGDAASCAPGTATINEGGANPLALPVRCSTSVQATSDANGALGFAATSVGTPRESVYTYNATGQVLTINGPRIDVSDVTTYTYDPSGNVATITNAAGHATSITSYNAHGQALTVTDANGLTTTMTYDERQRLKSRSVGGEVTGYDYDAAGQLKKVTLPDGSFLAYDYDPAHRLVGMNDNLGNSITYALDAMGNRTAEQVLDPSPTLVQTRSRVYNSLNRLFQELGAQSQTTEYGYDDQGNVTSVKDPLNKVTSNQYDALNRLRQVTDPGLGVTQYGYNGLDALTSVSDPRALVTGYTVDGLGNLTQQQSPDTGTTTNSYDAAGNLLTQTDAKGQVTTYAYDVLNRVTLITFHDGSKQQYAYDTGANGIGRLASITELDPANQQTNKTSYAYEPHGRVLTIGTEQAGVTYNVGYSYDSAGRLSGMTYPSGRTVTYGLDSLGRVNLVTTTKPGASALVVVSNVSYHPFGGVKGYTLGNGQVYTRSVDLDGRIASYTLGSRSYFIAFDAASRIWQIFDDASPINQNTYQYDALDRLTNAVIPGVPYAYGYDAVGNRTSKTVGGSTEAYTYGATSNRIATVGNRTFTFDLNGSTTNDGNNTYIYDPRGRMVQATSSIGATNYKVNALGQRIRKTNSLGDTVFHYDTTGKLIAETDPGGGLKRELIYLGDVPVGVVQ